MNIFDELRTIYSEIDNTYATIELQERARRHVRKEQQYQRKRELNDQAYFLFMFSRLEDRIKELSDNLIDFQHNNLTNWSYKRTWNILYKRKNQNSNSIYFMDRVALLTEMGETDYNLIERYYKQRNKIAHGQTFTIPINIPTVIVHMKHLYSDLKK
ncbi:MAG: hypothetical protein HQ534_05610 [Armatimonadetes bacterium]|nr:hypothetical protein [Armatimonadota bacterium]